MDDEFSNINKRFVQLMVNVAYVTLTSESWAYLVIVPTGASVQHVGHPTSCKACQGECDGN